MSKRRKLSPEEKDLWDGFVRGVKRLIEGNDAPTSGPTMPPSKPSPSPENKPPKPQEKPTPPPPKQAVPQFNLSRRSPTRVRRVAIEGRIDLHGLTREQAYSRLSLFLEHSQLAGKTWVLVITGKGTADRPSIIRQSAPDWLDANPLRKIVAEYSSAKPQEGGEGALYVRLKKSARLERP